MKSLINKLVGLAGARGLASALQAVSLVVLARGVSVDMYGAILGFIGAGQFLSVLFDFGVGNQVLRDFGRESVDRDRKQRVFGLMYIGLGVLLLTLVATHGFFSSLSLVTFLVLAVWQVLERYSESLIYVLIARGEDRSATWAIMIRRVPGVLLQVILILCGVNGLLSYELGLVVCGVAPFALFVMTRYVWISPALPDRALLRGSLSFWVTSMFSQTRELEAPVLLSIGGSLASSAFGIANKLMKPFTLFTNATAQMILPLLAQGPKRGPEARRVWWALLGTFSGVLVLSVIAGLLAGPLVPLLFGTEYASITSTVQVCLFFVSFFAFGAPLENCLQAYDEQRAAAWIAVVFATMGLAALVVGYNLGGSAVAALAVGVVYCTRFCVLLVSVARAMSIRSQRSVKTS